MTKANRTDHAPGGSQSPTDAATGCLRRQNTEISESRRHGECIEFGECEASSINNLRDTVPPRAPCLAPQAGITQGGSRSCATENPGGSRSCATTDAQERVPPSGSAKCSNPEVINKNINANIIADKSVIPNNGELSTGRNSFCARLKKAEGKRNLPPCTPYKEKARGKKTVGVYKRNRLSCAPTHAPAYAPTHVRTRSRVRQAIDADLDLAVRTFHGTAYDRCMWAAVAWRVGAERFHEALMDKLAEDAVDKPTRRPAAAFQAFLNKRFPKGGAV